MRHAAVRHHRQMSPSQTNVVNASKQIPSQSHEPHQHYCNCSVQRKIGRDGQVAASSRPVNFSLLEFASHGGRAPKQAVPARNRRSRIWARLAMRSRDDVAEARAQRSADGAPRSSV
eukprot:5247246-Pleurochrysis_carterae.AAC.2